MSAWCPTGYAPFHELRKTISKLGATWGIVRLKDARLHPLHLAGERARGNEDPLLRLLGPLLLEGRLKAAAVINSTGELLAIPPVAWRRVPRRLPYTDIGPSPQSYIEAALHGEAVQFPFEKDSNIVGRPIVALRDLAEVLEAKNLPPGPQIRPLQPAAAANVTAPITTQRGRPARHDWDAFFGEVAIFAAAWGLEDVDRPRLQSHMEVWAAQQWTDPPDSATIRAKLKRLFEAVSKRV